MFSKVLETAILQLVADANAAADGGDKPADQTGNIAPTNQTATTPAADLKNFNDQMAYYSSFAV